MRKLSNQIKEIVGISRVVRPCIRKQWKENVDKIQMERKIQKNNIFNYNN